MAESDLLNGSLGSGLLFPTMGAPLDQDDTFLEWDMAPGPPIPRPPSTLLPSDDHDLHFDLGGTLPPSTEPLAEHGDDGTIAEWIQLTPAPAQPPAPAAVHAFKPLKRVLTSPLMMPGVGSAATPTSPPHTPRDASQQAGQLRADLPSPLQLVARAPDAVVAPAEPTPPAAMMGAPTLLFGSAVPLVTPPVARAHPPGLTPLKTDFGGYFSAAPLPLSPATPGAHRVPSPPVVKVEPVIYPLIAPPPSSLSAADAELEALLSGAPTDAELDELLQPPPSVPPPALMPPTEPPPPLVLPAPVAVPAAIAPKTSSAPAQPPRRRSLDRNERRSLKRMRNRVSASRCRDRKRVWLHDLQGTLSATEQYLAALEARLKALRAASRKAASLRTG